MSLKKNSLILCIFSVLLLSGFPAVSAQEASQSGILELVAPETIIAHEPDNFSFPVSFIDAGNTFSTYALLNPSQAESTLEIFDSNDASGFLVTVAMTDFASTSNPDHIIHATDLGMVSLAQSPEGVDSASFNRPPGAPNVTPFLKCPWNPLNGSLDTQCESYMAHFSDLPGSLTSLANDLNINDNEIAVTDSSGLYSPLPGETAEIIIDNDIIIYSGITGNLLLGLSGISAVHTAGSNVIQHWNTSGQLALLENNSTLDTGDYKIGFGFRLNIRPEFKQDYYSGTLLFTLITI